MYFFLEKCHMNKNKNPLPKDNIGQNGSGNMDRRSEERRVGKEC